MPAGLVTVAVLQAPAQTRGWTIALGVLLIAAQVAVRRWMSVPVSLIEDTRGAWWPDVAAMGALVALWVALLVASPTALWVAFPLMLLQMHTLGPHRGALLVAVTTVAAVAHGIVRHPDGTAVIGPILGPILGALVSVGFVVGLEALVRESQERQRLLDELGATRAHLAEAERDRIVAIERERLAREIHDTLAQGFSAIELLLRTASHTVGSDDARTADLVAQARGAAQDNLAEARRVVQALAPADLSGSSLIEAVRRVAGRASGDGCAVRVHTTGTPRPLSVAIETALLRIVQSALANVNQHSGATRADVTLSFAEDAVLLDVVDDGRGFDPQTIPASSGGFGLVAMRSRVRELGGTLELESAPGGPTAIAVTLPVGTAGDTTERDPEVQP